MVDALDSRSASGLWSSFYKEFNQLYIYNLWDNAQTFGEQRRKNELAKGLEPQS